MDFTLIYDGDLPSGGNKSKARFAGEMRNVFHAQLTDLWNGHVVLRQLARTARTIPNPGAGYLTGNTPIWSPKTLPDYREPIPPLRDGQTDFCHPIDVPGVGSFIPLVRNSLYLACALKITFLRHEEPLNLMKQGGDLDGRLKTLFDGLRMPTNIDEQGGIALAAGPLYVLLEDDILVSDLSIKTGRLLGGGELKKHAVRLTIDVSLRVLRVFAQNQCLVGG